MSRNDLSGVQWRKSSYSDGQANCVEGAAIAHGHRAQKEVFCGVFELSAL